MLCRDKFRQIGTDAGGFENDILAEVIEILCAESKIDTFFGKRVSKRAERIGIFFIASDDRCTAGQQEIDDGRIGNAESDNGNGFAADLVAEGL